MKIKSLVFLILASFTAVAQSETRHMIDFRADSLIQTTLSFDKSKIKGSAADNDTQLDLNLNYAYSLPAQPRLQLGSKLNYNKGTQPGFGDFENYGLDVGAILNFSAWNNIDTVDLMNSAYLSFFIGMGWSNEYSGLQDRKNEFLSSVLALGKRWDLTRWKVGQLTYSPEIALENKSSTMGKALEYSQSLRFKALQFSFFW